MSYPDANIRPRRSRSRVVYGGGGTPPAFSPGDLAGLIAYYQPSQLASLFQDGAMTTPVTADGDPVGAMRDLSGNGHHLVQAADTTRPSYRTSGGLHWLESTATNMRLNQASFPATATMSITLGAVVTSTTTSFSGLMAMNATNDFQVASGSTGEMRYSVATSGLGGSPTSTTDFLNQSVTFTITFDASGGASTSRVNGTQLSTAAYNGAIDTTQDLLLFTNRGGGNGVAARVYGLVIWNSASSDEIAQVETWMNEQRGA